MGGKHRSGRELPHEALRRAKIAVLASIERGASARNKWIRMRIQILGCSGGVGPGLRTTSLLVDDRLLIDAGSGVEDLSLDQMRRIERIFLTHSHLDHICGLAFMADNLFGLVDRPLQIRALPQTLAAIRQHLFNWVIWPDFFQLPNRENALLVEQPLLPQQLCVLHDELMLTAIEVAHTVPAVGYSLASGTGVFVFSGDTGAGSSLIEHLNRLPRVDLLMIEVAFPDEDAELSEASRHFTPSKLAAELAGLRHRPELLLTHHKPGSELRIEQQCRRVLSGWRYRHLQRGEVFEV